MQRVLTTVVLLGLLLASAGAFALTEHLKLIKSPVYATHVSREFSPVCGCATAKAEIGFTLRRPDSVTVTVVDTGGNPVDTIASGVSEPARAVTFSWDGHTSTGGVAPDGVYQPEITLANARRTIRMPNRITIDTVAPKVLSASSGHGTLIAGADHGVAVQYVLSEPARVSVVVGGKQVIFGRPSRPHDKVNWHGTRGGRALPAGRYVLEIAAVDSAGNRTPPDERKHVVVQIRYIALAETSIHVTPGGVFNVLVRTAAPKYTWRFAGRNGIGVKPRLRLRAPAKRGRYRLVVSERGHSASAIVTVGRK